MNQRTKHERHNETPSSLRPGEQVIVEGQADGLGGKHSRMAVGGEDGSPRYSVPIGADAVPISNALVGGEVHVYRMPAGGGHLNLAALDDTPFEVDKYENLYVRMYVSPGKVVRFLGELVQKSGTDGGEGTAITPDGLMEMVDGANRGLNGLDENGAVALGNATVEIDDTDSPYTVPDGIITIFADATGGAITVNFPTVVGLGDRSIRVVKVDASANKVTPTSADKINGAGTYDLLNQYDAAVFEKNSVTWFITAKA